MGRISGHVDILQVRGSRIYVLDYKPDARRKKGAVAQLTSYANAISFRRTRTRTGKST